MLLYKFSFVCLLLSFLLLLFYLLLLLSATDETSYYHSSLHASWGFVCSILYFIICLRTLYSLCPFQSPFVCLITSFVEYIFSPFPMSVPHCAALRKDLISTASIVETFFPIIASSHNHKHSFIKLQYHTHSCFVSQLHTYSSAYLCTAIYAGYLKCHYHSCSIKYYFIQCVLDETVENQPKP